MCVVGTTTLWLYLEIDCIDWECLGMAKRLLIYRVKKSRFCLWTWEKQVCFGVCRIVVSSSSDDRGVVEICPVHEEGFDELVNGDDHRG